MPRNRLPQAKAEVSGAAIKHPERFGNRKAPKRLRPIGEPYVRLTDEEKAIWFEFSPEMPWLDSSDRPLFELLCRRMAKARAEPDLGVNATQVIISLLSKLGATPVDKSKILYADGDGEEPEDGFFGRPN